MEDPLSTYEKMRHFADSWGLVGISIVFAIAVASVLRPGAKARALDAADIPLRDDEPGPDGAGANRRG
ncbi:MAG: cbb3-type cytochrome c oxidase subunit 3 [Rubrimonas sp.]|uniref:cbb3-type cytochrome c oxidase subunit 3 n=1 Tax=Rubrimonas sp. TaxID=2036015 RepID=UPI002FDEAC93